MPENPGFGEMPLDPEAPLSLDVDRADELTMVRELSSSLACPAMREEPAQPEPLAPVPLESFTISGMFLSPRCGPGEDVGPLNSGRDLVTLAHSGRMVFFPLCRHSRVESSCASTTEEYMRCNGLNPLPDATIPDLN